LRVRCSKGTYVRTLIEDLAGRLGTLAHVIALRRLAVEPFGGQAMLSIEQIEAAAGPGPLHSLEALDALLRPLEAALPSWPAIELDASAALRVSRGGAVLPPPGHFPGLVRLYAPGHRFLGVGELQPDGLVAPRRLVAQVPASFPDESISGL
jgi:tRNA pseudouridine55 synthase